MGNHGGQSRENGWSKSSAGNPEPTTTALAFVHRLQDYLQSDDAPDYLHGQIRIGIDEDEESLPRLLRRLWMQGRFRTELRLCSQCLRGKGVRDRQVAERLRVTRSAVSQWCSGLSGIEPENLELVRRHFQRELAGIAPPSTHAIDRAGYCFAIARVQLNLRGRGVEEELSPLEFWSLWFLYRSPGFRLAWMRRRVAAIEQLWRGVFRQLVRLFGSAASAQLPCLTDERLFFDFMRQTMVKWGSSFLIVIWYLDDVCWTGPETSIDACSTD